MQNCNARLPHIGTEKQGRALCQVIEEHREQQGALMPILQKAQEIYGYLPEKVLIAISEELDIPLSEVYGVVTFYSQFSLTPKGEHKISVCMGTACYVKGAGEILNKICEKVGCQPGECSENGKFSVDAVRCIGACGLAPVVTVDDEVFGRLTVDDVDRVLAKFMDE